MYIYDILLNFKNSNYDFFDWNLNDAIVHIKKIPIIKVSSLDMNKIYNYDFLLDTSILNKTEYYTKRNISTNKKSCIFTDGNLAMAVLFKNNQSFLRSNLLIDEEEEVLKMSKKMSFKKIDYKLLNKKVIDPFKTRKQINSQFYLCKKLKKLNDQELSYLYFDFYNKREKNRSTMLEKIENEINNNVLSHDVINNFLKLISI